MGEEAPSPVICTGEGPTHGERFKRDVIRIDMQCQ